MAVLQFLQRLLRELDSALQDHRREPDRGTGYVRFWMYHETQYSTLNDWINVQYSTNGTTWTSIGSSIYRYDGSTGWKQHEVVLTGVSGASVQVGLLGTGAFGNDMHVDDVRVLPGCRGAAADSHGSDRLLLPCRCRARWWPVLSTTATTWRTSSTAPRWHNVTPDAGGGAEAMTGPTPDDPALTDGFYWIFAPLPPFEGPSTRTFEASMSGFGTETKEHPGHPEHRQPSRLHPRQRLPGGDACEPSPARHGLWHRGDSPQPRQPGRARRRVHPDRERDASCRLRAGHPGRQPQPVARGTRSVPWADLSEMNPNPPVPVKGGSSPTAWGTSAPFPGTATYSGATASCDGMSFYVMGGSPVSGTTNLTWKYDPPPTPGARSPTCPRP